jgi:hypothetical protein
MSWIGRDATFKNKLKAYVDNVSTLSITDLLSSSYVGKFINFNFSETRGLITYDIQADFRQVTYPTA